MPPITDSSVSALNSHIACFPQRTVAHDAERCIAVSLLHLRVVVLSSFLLPFTSHPIPPSAFCPTNS